MLIDAHHHLWSQGLLSHDPVYMAGEYLADVAGVGLSASVFVECLTHYDENLPPPLRSTGETRFAAAVGARFADGPVRLCAAIVAYADPLADMPFATILDAHLAAGGGRLRAIRRCAAWDSDPALVYPTLATSEFMLADPRFAIGLHALAERGLAFETWVYHPQVREVAALARAVPDCPVILDHAGTPMVVGRHADVPATIALWREEIARAAEVPSLHVKIGGFATLGTAVDAVRVARGLERWTAPALAETLSPFLDHLLACFGPERCLFESNFPVDRGACDYATLWQAYRAALSGLDAAATAAVCGGNAARLYGITGG